MNSYHDPELEDVLQDDELRRVAAMLGTARTPEPPLDDAFRTDLRRQLMQEAWAMSDGRNSWWRRAFAPPGLAWAGAAAGLLLIAAVVVYTSRQPPGGLLIVQSPFDGNRALDVVSAKGGAIVVIAPDGVTSPSISPAGDRIAYIRGGKIEVLTFASAKTEETTPTPAPTLVGCAKDKLVWAAGDGVYAQGDNGPTKLAPLPATETSKALSIAPDGAHAIYQLDQRLFVLDLGTGKSVEILQASATFVGWSPSGTLLLYSTPEHLVVADALGVTQTSLPTGEASWSTQDAIL